MNALMSSSVTMLTSLALGAGGNTGSDSNATEEWTAGDFQIKTVTTS